MLIIEDFMTSQGVGVIVRRKVKNLIIDFTELVKMNLKEELQMVLNLVMVQMAGKWALKCFINH